MATVGTYKALDRAFVREGIFSPGWVPDPLPSSAWLGIVQDGEYLVPDPAPRSSGDPAIYGAWDLVYDELQGCYEESGAPVRWGRLRVTGLLQKGARTGYLDTFFEAVVARVAAAEPDGPLGFTLQEAKPVALGNLGPWRLQMLEIPFVGA